MSQTPVSNTSIGAAAAIPFAVGGVGFPTESFIAVGLGSFVCNGASAVTVADAAVTASSIIVPTLGTVGGTVGAIPAVKTITPGTGFTIAGTASDTSTYAYLRFG